MSTKSLYVGNLPYNTTEEELRELFEAWGPITETRVVIGRGFGFVDLPADNMQAAIDGTHGKEFQGRVLTVNEARPRTERRSDSGYGGGGRSSSRGGGRGYGGSDRPRERRW